MLDITPGQGLGPNLAFHDIGGPSEGFREALMAGLSQPRKAIPCRFLYDRAGSELFDRICDLPEYYPTRTELRILGDHAEEIGALVGRGAGLMELGSGSGNKTRMMLDAVKIPTFYMPIDISRQHLRQAARDLTLDYPTLQIIAVCTDYSEPDMLPRIHARGRRVAFFPGSTIGNLAPREAGRLLERWRRHLGTGGLMVVGVDLRKEPEILHAAYDDGEGITAAFIRNILRRANRELHADFDPDSFAYEARWEPGPGRVRMSLISTTDQKVRVSGRTFTFGKGEPLHVEDSHKYEIAEFQAVARGAGFVSRACLLDGAGLFSVHVLGVADS